MQFQFLTALLKFLLCILLLFLMMKLKVLRLMTFFYPLFLCLPELEVFAGFPKFFLLSVYEKIKFLVFFLTSLLLQLFPSLLIFSIFGLFPCQKFPKLYLVLLCRVFLRFQILSRHSREMLFPEEDK